MRIGSLRARLALAGGALAALALAAALLAVFGMAELSRRADTANRAQDRMELISALSARLGEYAILAAEEARLGTRSAQQRQVLLAPQGREVERALDQLDASYRDALNAARSDVDRRQRETARRVVDRMREQFLRLRRTLLDQDGMDPTRLRIALDSFATQFSPLVDRALSGARLDRDVAFAAAETFRGTLGRLGWLVAIMAAIGAVGFVFGLVRPLIRRIEALAQRARAIASGTTTPLPPRRRDELGLALAEVERTALRLQRRQRRIESDRTRLNEIVAERTAALEAANAELGEADARRRRLFADISHELRTPLTAMIAEADLARRGAQVDEEAIAAAFTTIAERGRGLNRRIDDLLRVARSESGQLDLRSEPFDVRAACEAAVREMAPVARRRGVQLVGPVGESAHAAGDADWFRQLVTGLLDNALRHTPSGGRVTVTIAEDGRMISAAVADTGEGVPAADRARVLERFERAAAAQRTSGFGVGLALARWVIERQHGSIELESPVPSDAGQLRPAQGESGPYGPGTRVTLRLPCAPGPGGGYDDREARPDRGGRF